MIVDVFISECAKFNLLHSNLNTKITNIDIPEGNTSLNIVSAPICNVFESIQKFFGPELEEVLIISEYLASFVKELLEGFSLLDVEEVEVVVFICHIIKSQIWLEIFGSQKLLASSNLTVKLVQYFKMGEASWNLIALHSKIFVRTKSQHFLHSCIVLFEDLDGLFSEVDLPNPPIYEFFLNLNLVFLKRDMWQFNVLQRIVVFRNSIPNEGLAILW